MIENIKNTEETEEENTHSLNIQIIHYIQFGGCKYACKHTRVHHMRCWLNHRDYRFGSPTVWFSINIYKEKKLTGTSRVSIQELGIGRQKIWAYSLFGGPTSLGELGTVICLLWTSLRHWTECPLSSVHIWKPRRCAPATFWNANVKC